MIRFSNGAGAAAPAVAPKVRAFSFGSPEPVLQRRDILDILECLHNGRWYEPPISMRGLARLFRVAAHHSSALIFKRNLLLRSFRPTRLMSTATFGKWVLDYLTMGNSYLELRPNMLGGPLELVHSLALYTRRGVKPGAFFFVTDARAPHELAADRVHHLYEPDLAQEIYGLPEYLSAMQSSLLNEAATLFRRRYYENGSHAGFILYSTDAGMSDESWETVETELGNAKGPGNFKNLLLHVPDGKEKGLQLIPIAEVAAKDEFLNIKNVSRDDMLAAHRMPPMLMGIIPANAGGFGDPAKATDVFVRNEIEPIQRRLLEVNEWVGEEAVRFDPYEPAAAPAAKGPSA